MTETFSKVRNAFIAGLAVILPLALTLWVVVKVAGLIDSFLDVLPEQIHPEKVLGIPLPGLGILLTVIVVVSVGAGTRYYIGRRIVTALEDALLRVPLLSGIYQGLKKLFDTLFGDEGMKFRQVVLVEYPRRGAWALAFLTGEALWVEAEQDMDGDTPLSIFLPSTPNPTTGFYMVIPARDVRRVDMSVEEAFKVIMSAGIVHPDRRVEWMAVDTEGLPDLPQLESSSESPLDATLDREIGGSDGL